MPLAEKYPLRKNFRLMGCGGAALRSWRGIEAWKGRFGRQFVVFERRYRHLVQIELRLRGLCETHLLCWSIFGFLDAEVELIDAFHPGYKIRRALDV